MSREKTFRHVDNDRATVKFNNTIDSLQILYVKKDLRSLEPTKLGFPKSIFLISW